MSSEPTEPAPSIPGTSSIPPEPSVSSTASSFSASLVNGIPEFVPRRSAVLPPSEHATPETHPDDSDESCDPGRGPAGGRGGVDYPSSMTFPSFTAQTPDTSLDETFSSAISANHEHTNLSVEHLTLTSVPPSMAQTQGLPRSSITNMPSYYNQLNSVPIDVGSRHSDAGVMTLLFDHHEQLIWQGNSVGHVTSYYGPQLRKYSSFQVHQSHPIRQLETVENALISLTQNSLRLSQRGGLTLYDFPTFFDCDFQCMLLLDQVSLMLGGHQNSTLMLDLQTAQIVSRIPSLQDDVVIMRSSESCLCFGHSNGYISFVDPNSLSTIKCIQTHSGSLTDFSVSGNTLVSCGFSAVSDQLVIDNFVNVYDIRNCRLIFSHQFNVNPFYVRFFPMYNNRALVLSQFGHFQIVDPSGLAIPESLVLHKVALSNPETVITACDVSSTSRALIFGDSSGILQLYGDNPDPLFNEYANPTEFPNPPSSNMYIAFDDYSIPLSAVPFPYTPSALPFLSDLPKSILTSRYYDAPKIPTEIESKIEYSEFIGYAPFPVGWIPNQVPYKPHEYLEHLPESLSSRDGSPLNDEKSALYPDGMPAIYEKVSPPCLGDSFQDDLLSNLKVNSKTSQNVSRKFPTMENNSINGYANMLIYALSTIEPLNAYIRSHLCKRELCLTCEVSCIVDTLKRAPADYSFAPYNFLRVFSMLPETTALGLVISEFDDSPNASNSYSKLLQSFNRFLLQQLHQEFQRDEELCANSNLSQAVSSSHTQSGSSEISDKCNDSKEAQTKQSEDEGSLESLSEAVANLLGVITEQTSTCKCGNEVRRESCNFTTPLIYPDLFGLGPGPRIISFENVVKYSLTSENSTQAWCSKCHKYQPTVQKKKILKMPHLLSLNCQLDKQREVAFWKVQQKLSHDPKCQSELSAPNTTVGMCRFGNNCTRKDCKFRHEKDSDIQASIERFVKLGDNNFDWVPRCLKMLNPNHSNEPTENKNEHGKKEFEYELAASVLHVPAKGTRGHMVARVKLNDKYYVINDTAINEISEIEMNKFNLNWAVPCILFFINKNLPNSFRTLKLPAAVKREFLSDEMKLVELNKGLRKIFSPITPDEEFDIGCYVGLDMNIISNCKQETDINPDGSYKTITSTENSIIVTRVVCFRGNSSKIEPLASLPLIDDHAQSKETVVEYINKLGGLDMNGGKHLATFKQTFLKLKYLVDRKVIVVGHNIERKLKMFNLFVPKDQLRDTASIYRLSRHDSLSLKFMADYFGIPYHRSDVLRDCYASLQLYNNYLKITNDGRTMQAFRMSLQEMYNSAGATKQTVMDKTGCASARGVKKP